MKGHGNTPGDNEASERWRYVFGERPACPECGEKKLRTIRSVTNDHVSTRRTECLNRRCRHKFFIVWE